MTKVRCKDLPDSDWGDFRCQRAMESSSFICDSIWKWPKLPCFKKIKNHHRKYFCSITIRPYMQTRTYWVFTNVHPILHHRWPKNGWNCLMCTIIWFLAATKQLYKWYFPSVRLSVCPSVCLSVCLSHLFDYVPIIVSSWNFQGLLPMTKVRSMQKVKVRGQRSRSQRSQPNLTVSGL